MKTLIIQKCFVFNGDHFIALRRSKSDVRRPLQWDLPGGWLEERESFLDGVTREVKEETGLDIQDIRLAYSKTEVRTHKEGPEVNKKGNCVFMFYIAKAANTEVRLSEEHIEHSWMTLEEAEKAFEYTLHKETTAYIRNNDLLAL